MKKRKDSGLQRFRTTVEGYRRGEIQEMRVQDRKRFKTRWIQKRRDIGKKSSRQEDAEQERCWTGQMQERRDAGLGMFSCTIVINTLFLTISKRVVWLMC